MRYIALACDYDGTLALKGRVDEPTRGALERLLATGRKLVLDAPVAAHTAGTPTDIAADEDLLVLIESNAGGMAHITQFSIDEDGDLMQVTTSAIASRANGVAIVRER